MMISPEAAYEFNLEDKSKEGIEKEIAKVKRRIARYKRLSIEAKKQGIVYLDDGPDIQLEWNQKYLKILNGVLNAFTKAESKSIDIKQITISRKSFSFDAFKYVWRYSITVKYTGEVIERTYNGSIEKIIDHINKYTIDNRKVDEAFSLINEMLPKINGQEGWLDDSTIYMTVTFEDGRRVKVDREKAVDGESIVYKAMRVLGL